LGENFALNGLVFRENQQLKGFLPENVYVQLILKVGAASSIRRHQIAATQDAIAEWILSCFAKIISAIRDGHFHRGHERGVPTGSIEVELIWQKIEAPSFMFWARGLKQGSLEPKRRAELTRTIEKKANKLRGWNNLGAHDVLILDHWDLALSAPQHVRSTFHEICETLTYVPTSVFVVDTSNPLFWIVAPVRRSGQSYAGHQSWSFDSAELRDPRK